MEQLQCLARRECWTIIVLAVLAQPVYAIQLSPGPAASCTDAEVARYAVALAVGPAPGAAALRPPRCVPSGAQTLQPLGLQSFSNLTKTPQFFGLPTHASNLSLHSANLSIQGETYFLHFFVAQSYERWCAAPCQSPTWELQAPKPEAGSPYALFEAGIWQQERRVALYQFNTEWERKAKNVYHEVCHGQWECPAYHSFREEKCLLSIGPWPASADEDPRELSAFLLNAFKQFVDKIQERVTHAEHAGLTYTGHGAAADGSLFEGTLDREDAVSFLQYMIGAEGRERLSLLNFGGNCAEGRWNMVANLHPYAEWITGSDLLVGGVEYTDEENNQELVNAMERLRDVALLKRSVEAQESMTELVETLKNGRQETWDTIWKGPIKRQKLQQTFAAYNGPNFEPLQSAFRTSYLKLSGEQRDAFQSNVEQVRCDVLDGLRFIDNALSEHLETSFLDFRPVFARTEYAVTNGLGFNYLGWKEPPCDIKTALGPDAPSPPDGWHGERYRDRKSVV